MKSSGEAPASTASLYHCGCRPRPLHVRSGFSGWRNFAGRGEVNAPFLPPRQRWHRPIGKLGNAAFGHHIVDFGVAACIPPAIGKTPHRHHITDMERPGHGQRLRQPTDAPRARQPIQLGETLAIDPHARTHWAFKPGKNAHQAGLTRAIGADQRRQTAPQHQMVDIDHRYIARTCQ